MRSFETLIGCLKRLPGIGAKQAERLAVHMLRVPRSEMDALSSAIIKVRERVRRCAVCQDFTEDAEQAFEHFRAAGMHLVKAAEPMAEWLEAM